MAAFRIIINAVEGEVGYQPGSEKSIEGRTYTEKAITARSYTEKTIDARTYTEKEIDDAGY